MYVVTVVDKRDVDSSEPESTVGQYESLAKAIYEMNDYLVFAAAHGMEIVKMSIEVKK